VILRCLCRWLTPLAVLVLWTTAARADSETDSGRVPVLGYFLAFLFTVLTLVILCMPSRKS